jgi:D-alanyl-lipoteichoic acid acyltransferase DltB (MBOAT superfamily)
MLFSSIVFIFYFLPVTLGIYYVLRFSRPLQNLFLFVASLVFYAWAQPKFVVLLLVSIMVNYIIGILIDQTKNQKKRKIWLVVGVTLNILYLGYFKYMYFILRNIDSSGYLISLVPAIALPLGISFYTFQAISYVVDVYRNDVPVQKNPLSLGLYIALFPQLISGPIVRYTLMVEQISYRQETVRMFSVGVCRFIKGLGKKLFLANTMGIVADRIFTMNSEGLMPMSLAFLGSVSYSLQIFFDFASYSDMAIGLSYMLGFKVPENFNYPYISKSVTEFWRRWHITLGDWFKNYVYFPLGGSRVKNTDILIRNLLIVWLLTGIWHGAEWTFIIWGIFNFLCITIEKLFGWTEKKNIAVVQHIYMFFVIIFSWTLFRVESLTLAGRYFQSMFGAAGLWSDYTWMFLREYGVYYILCLIFCMPISRRFNTMLIQKTYKNWGLVVMGFYPFFMLIIFIISLSFLIKGTYSPFIYFKF